MMTVMMLMSCSGLMLTLALAAASASRSSSSSSSSSAPSAPRMKLSYKELQQFHGVRRFDLDRSCCFGALLLDEERGRLFVGAKNFLLSLSLDNIAKQEHKIYWPAPVDWREECNWAGKDITTCITQCFIRAAADTTQSTFTVHSHERHHTLGQADGSTV